MASANAFPFSFIKPSMPFSKQSLHNTTAIKILLCASFVFYIEQNNGGILQTYIFSFFGEMELISE